MCMRVRVCLECVSEGGGDRVTTDNDTDVKHSAVVVFFFTRLSGLI